MNHRKESSVQGSSTALHGTGRSDRREKRQRGDEHGGRVNTVGGACLAAAERATGVPEATVLHDS